ncbi:MAG TPA: helix-turn-helix domain-containing protein [Jatrophihabitans sp.]|nr:helix-turn-helix domain-containing protein [Jatrophihabitans sp.]
MPATPVPDLTSVPSQDPAPVPDPVASRAAPLSRDERRATIIAATLPLLHEHGQAVTTRQIAEASGIAEGTIFRVFTDKAELVDACLTAAFDPRPALERFAAIDRALPLEPRLTAAVEILQERLRIAVGLLMALGFGGPSAAKEREAAKDRGMAEDRNADPRDRFGSQELLDALAGLLEPDRDRLRLPPAETAGIARVLTFAASHPRLTEGHPMTAEQIVSLLLHGVLVHDGDRAGGAPC